MVEIYIKTCYNNKVLKIEKKEVIKNELYIYKLPKMFNMSKS